jgi:adenylate kinase
MGIAGSGKGTQGKLLQDTYGFKWMSSGDILRAHLTAERREQMLAGVLVGDEEMIGIWEEALGAIEDKSKCILDGFPRTIAQAEWLMSYSKKSGFSIDELIHLNASREAVISRLNDRGRPDDHGTAIEKRFREYEKSTIPIINWLKENGVRVQEIDGENYVEAVHNDIASKLKLV